MNGINESQFCALVHDHSDSALTYGERRGGASGENEKIQLKTQKKCSRYE